MLRDGNEMLPERSQHTVECTQRPACYTMFDRSERCKLGHGCQATGSSCGMNLCYKGVCTAATTLTSTIGERTFRDKKGKWHIANARARESRSISVAERGRLSRRALARGGRRASQQMFAENGPHVPPSRDTTKRVCSMINSIPPIRVIDIMHTCNCNLSHVCDVLP